MKTLKYMMAAAVLQAACMAVADMIPGDWRVDVGKRSVFRKEIYQGESVRLEATFFRDGKEFTPDFAAPMLYWQTNGMGRSYFSAPAVVSSNAVCAVWDGSKDCGARYYHGFIGETGVTYRAEFEFKMVPSPGFAPNALPLPVQVLDFAAVEVANAPWPSAADLAGAVSNTVTKTYVEDLGISATSLAPATNYTDSAIAAAENRITNAIPRADTAAASWQVPGDWRVGYFLRTSQTSSSLDSITTNAYYQVFSNVTESASTTLAAVLAPVALDRLSAYAPTGVTYYAVSPGVTIAGNVATAATGGVYRVRGVDPATGAGRYVDIPLDYRTHVGATVHYYFTDAEPEP